MMQNNSKIFNVFTKTAMIFFVLALFCLSSFALAKVDLEIDFPSFGGERLTGDSKLPAVINYVFNFALVISAMAVAVSILYAGFSYLSSAGQPIKMSQARKRFFNSIIGLVIIFSSFLILRIVDPNFLVLKINKVPVNTGILFLNETAFNDSATKNDLQSINPDIRNTKITELLTNPVKDSDGNLNPRAVYMAWNDRDLRDRFGEFVVGSPLVASQEKFDPRFKFASDWKDSEDNEKKFNFENFKLYGLFFLPNTNIKVTTYYFHKFNTDVPVDYWGWVKIGLDIMNPGSVSPTPGGSSSIIDKLLQRWKKLGYTDIINEYQYPKCSALDVGGPCKFIMLDGLFENGNFSFSQRKSVPLSVKVENIGKGVLLRSEEFGQEFSVLNHSHEIANLDSHHFDDKTTEIEIKNWEFEHFQDIGDPDDTSDDIDKLVGKKEKNYLVVLYDDPFFQGKFRLFFEEFRDLISDETRGNLPTPDKYNDEIDDANATTQVGISKIEVKDEPDAYGRVDGVSSVRVFEMPQTALEKELWAARGGCKVKLCVQTTEGTLPSSFHDCLIYTFDSLETPQMNNPSPSELFMPFNVPDEAKTAYVGDGTVEKNDDGTDKEINFREKRIVSMQIEGNCIVTLFQNPVDELKCELCLRNGNDCNKCWKDKSPGDHSEVFGPGDGEYPNYQNLSKDNLNHQIGKCNFLGGWAGKSYTSCISSLAVFPTIPD